MLAQGYYNEATGDYAPGWAVLIGVLFFPALVAAAVIYWRLKDATKNEETIGKLQKRIIDLEHSDSSKSGILDSQQQESQSKHIDFHELRRNVSKSKDAKLWREAAEQGDAEAQYHLGNAYEYGFGVSTDHKEADKWFRKAAEQGNIDAETSLGLNYMYGIWVKENQDEGLKWFKKAAEQGDKDAKEEVEQYEKRKLEEQYGK